MLNNGCTPEKPIKCPDGTCTAQIASCASSTVSICPSVAPIQCSDGTCVADKTQCLSTATTTNTCPSSKPFLCPDGSCVVTAQKCKSGGSSSASGKDQINQAIKILEAARRKFIRSSRIARTFNKNILSALGDIRIALSSISENCSENVINATNNLILLLDDIDSKVCQSSLRTSSVKAQVASKNCIPQQASDEFSNVVEQATGIIFSAINIDNDKDFIADVCEKGTTSNCQNDCSGHGTCSNGQCFCNAEFAGADCSAKL